MSRKDKHNNTIYQDWQVLFAFVSFNLHLYTFNLDCPNWKYLKPKQRLRLS